MNTKHRILLIGIGLVLFCVFIGTVSAVTIYVPDNYITIQAAVDAASPDDTIIVRDGPYTENINVYKRLTIQSENGADFTIVHAASSSDYVFEVTADYVNIFGFTIEGATDRKAGIYLDNVDHCNISDNIASNNNEDGIELSGSSHNLLSNNIATNNEYYGISLYRSCYNTLSNNTATSNNNDGIYLCRSSHNTLTNNTAIANNEDGIDLSSSSHNLLSSNTATSNNGEGIMLFSSSHNLLSSNTASNNFEGISLSSSSDYNTLSNNTALNNSIGIDLYYSNRNTLSSNTATLNNFEGISLSSSSNNKIYLNNFITNYGNNIASSNSTNIWNSPSEICYIYNGSTYTNYLGNYWGDYTKPDYNKDGIGDTPHIIIIDSDTDYYPLMMPFKYYFAPTATPTPKPEENGAPGFEAIFAIAGLFVIAYLLRKKRRKVII